MARQKHTALKDHLRELMLFQRRTIAAVALTIILSVVLIGRMVYLQIINHAHYTTLSHNNRVNIVPIAPTRGLIYDRNGVLLAENVPSYSLEIVPERVPNLAQTLKGLRKLIDISDDDIDRFKKMVKRTRRFEGVPLRFRLTDKEVARFAVNRYRFPGVDIEASLTRHYPLGRLAAHVVGYVGRINEEELRKVDASNYSGTSHIGKVGVERSYESVLHGEVGYQQVETNAQGRVLRVLERTPPTPGKNLYLNIDIKMQAIAERAFGDNDGSLVAIDPKTGAVLALVSMPSYDPNVFVNGLDAKTYKKLSTSPDRPLFNRAIRGQYPPGSTSKPFTALAGLELGVIKPTDEIFCPGYYQIEGEDRKYRDWKKWGHGHVDLHKAIVQSCDVYFYELAQNLGIDRLHDYLYRFGFGRKTGIDLQGELPGLMPSRAWKRRTQHLPWFPGETLITGIGQGFELATPLQLANITATLADQGHRMQPHVVYAEQNPDSNAMQVIPPHLLGTIAKVRQSDWDDVIHDMHDVVHSIHGTARRISHNLKYTIAGKTGTAQVFGMKQDEEYVEEDIAKKLRDHALFIGFAPVKDPKIAVAVIVEHGGGGGSVAAPIARQVMDYYLLESPEANHVATGQRPNSGTQRGQH